MDVSSSPFTPGASHPALTERRKGLSGEMSGTIALNCRESQTLGEQHMSFNLLLSKSRSKTEATGAPKRLDIQGLRAVAVGIVLLYHAGMPWMPGGFVGVDVFFVISGFLITGGIVKELRRDGKFSLARFYSRRIARILPASVLAVIGTIILTWAMLPQTRWVQVGQDALAGLLYYINWQFAADSVDYLAQGQASSPFQHFWSLAVEEQFYIIWPLLLMLVTWICMKTGVRLQSGLVAALAVVALPSLAWSAYLTGVSSSAYFVTTTRIWELAIGAGLAIMLPQIGKAPKLLSVVVGWLGLAAIGATAITYTAALPFPSYTALLPTMGAAAVIWAGANAGTAGPVAVLGLTPMRWIGDISYSLYLWHWPLLVIASALWGDLSPGIGLIVVAFAFLPAWLSLMMVERPLQEGLKGTRSKSYPFQIGFILTGVAAAGAMLLIVAVPPTPPASAAPFTPKPMAGAEARLLGAETLFDRPAPATAEDKSATLVPNVLQAAQDLHVVHRNGCMQPVESTAAKQCDFGDLKGTKTIAVVGDSHAAMLLPGFERVAEDKGWKLITYSKGACPWIETSINYQGKPFQQCSDWAAGVTQGLQAAKPDVIVAVTSRYLTNDSVVDSAEISQQKLVEGMRKAWTPFLDQGIPVISVRDTPRPGMSVPDCVASNRDALTRCTMEPGKVLSQNPPEVSAADGLDGVTVMDLTDAFCFSGTCPAVIGGVVVYRDDNHVTATYASSLHNQIDAILTPVVDAS